MLLKADIKNSVQMLSDEWYAARLAKYTASENYWLMGEKPLTQGMISYTYRKVYEELSGLPSKDEVNTRSTEHGHKYESEGIIELGKSLGVEFVVTQKLIHKEGSRFAATPDFLIPISESIDKQSWNVITGEIKCPQGENFIALARCKTPDDVYKISKQYYWQVIFQMDGCDSLMGLFGVYNPFVKVVKHNIVEFRKKDLLGAFKLVAERKIFAEKYFMEVRDEFINKN
jgi:hypothetical protein